MKKVFIISILLVLALVGCNKETTTVKENNNAPQEKGTTTTATNNKSKSTDVDTNQTDSKPQLRTDGKWVQLGARLYYLQGTVKSIQKNSDGKDVLNLLVEKSFQNPASGADNPYKNGQVYSFILKTLPTVELNQKKVIIYGGQVTSNDQDNFIGAEVVYYQLKNQLIDLNGKPAVIPPNDYPYQF